MSEIDQQFIEYVVKSLVGKPDAVSIERRIDEKGVLLELTVDPDDLGRVIGKRGATAQSLRTLLRALGTKNDARYNLKIIDNGPPGHTAPADDSAAPGAKEDDTASDAPAADDSAAPDAPEEPAEAEPAEAAEAPEQPATDKLGDEPEPATESEGQNTEAETSDRLKQARAELADLDDLDV